MTTLYQYCDELKLNIVAKRHSSMGTWDVRVTHPWYTSPLLSARNHPTFEEAILELNGRLKTLDFQRVGIERKNRARAEKFRAEERDVSDMTDDQWFNRFDGG